jgi:hypothetical protein
MKYISTLLICLIVFTSCKSDKTETALKEETIELTIAEKIANAHGFENWNDVSKVEFTFKVDRDTIKGKGRSWVWQPKTDDVIMIAGDKTVSYTRRKMDSTQIGTDRAFINDKYWLLVPFQLVWDTSATISEPKKTEAPISKTKMDMITVTYTNEGGYTPGDAYDIFYGDDYLIKEWVFRKGNSEQPTLATTFENYKDYNGIKIAIDHKQEGGLWNLNFVDINITVE